MLFYVDLFDAVTGPDIEAAWEDLRNKMQQAAGELLDGTAQPAVNSDYGDVAIATVALTGDGFSLAELEDVAEDLRTDLFRVEGITKVSFSGVRKNVSGLRSIFANLLLWASNSSKCWTICKRRT